GRPRAPACALRASARSRRGVGGGGTEPGSGAEPRPKAMSVVALEKHPCPACGAQAEWNPTKQKLVCPFCGTEAPYDINASGQIVELELVPAWREIPDEERGWQTARRTVQCRSCKAVSVFDPTRVGQRCEFCGSPELVPYEEIKSPIRPQRLLPFRVADPAVRRPLRRRCQRQRLP